MNWPRLRAWPFFLSDVALAFRVQPESRPLGLLALAASMLDRPFKGGHMIQDPDYGRRLAQNLLELLTPYEEELITLEREAPNFGALRRAIGIVIAEACYCITDLNVTKSTFAPPASDEANQSR